MTTRGLPDLSSADIKDTLDIIAKALLLRLGGRVLITEADRRRAADTQCEFELLPHGELIFRISPN